MARETTQEAFAATWPDGRPAADAGEADAYTAGHAPDAYTAGHAPGARPVYVIRAGGNRSRTADRTGPRGIAPHSVAGGTRA